MNCLNCRSQLLDTWLYCPQCGKSAFAGEQAVSTAQVTSETLLDGLSVGLVFITSRGRLGYINLAACALFGLKQNGNILGKPYQEFILNAECIEIIDCCLAQGSPSMRGDVSMVAKDSDEVFFQGGENQEHIYQVNSFPVYDKAEVFVGNLFHFYDITDLRIEHAIISHELSVPLTPITGFVRTLLDDANEVQYDKETRREFYTIIDDNVDRLSRVIHDLLNVARIERMGRAGIDMKWKARVGLRKTMEEVLATERRRTDKYTFVIDCEPEEIEFEADPAKTRIFSETSSATPCMRPTAAKFALSLASSRRMKSSPSTRCWSASKIRDRVCQRRT